MFYRIQPKDRNVENLLDRSTWQSRVWMDPWSDIRFGVSACRSIEELVAYFRIAGGWVDDCVIVEMVAEVADDMDHDHEHGAVLVYPVRIVSVQPLTNAMIAHIYEED